MSLRKMFATLGLVALAATSPARARGPLADPIPAPIPESTIPVKLVPVATGLTSPVDMVVVEGWAGRVFIVDQTGHVLLMKGGVIQSTPFLDISPVLSELSPASPGAPHGLNPGYDERGLLSLAFHPQFAQRGTAGYRTVYTLHDVPVTAAADFREFPYPDATVVPNSQEVIAEWKVSAANPEVVDPTTYREVLRYDKPEFNHNGGTLLFGPDGLLYASFGDGGNRNDIGPGHIPGTGNAQSLATILGKVIRVNPLNPRLSGSRGGVVSANGRYRIPTDNPFFSNRGSLKEIYAYGFRNPYKMSLDRPTDRLIVADVGQDHVEEVDVVVRGGNYGWHVKEGSFLFDPTTGNVFPDPRPNPRLINPALEYDHDDIESGPNANPNVAVIGGHVYRGSAIPRLIGKYVFADLSGRLFAGDLQTGRIERLLLVNLFIKGIGQDAHNELYVLGSSNIGPAGNGGTILAIRPPSP